MVLSAKKGQLKTQSKLRVIIAATIGACIFARAEIIAPVVGDNPPVVTISEKVEEPKASLFSGEIADALKLLAKGTNWMVVPYAIYDSGSKSAGGGVCALYNVTKYVGTGVRVDYLNGGLWMPSMSLQLQAPLQINKLTVVPFTYTGIATPIAGRGKDNGSVVGIIGVGASVHISKRLSIVADAERWTGFSGVQYRAGLLYKF